LSFNDVKQCLFKPFEDQGKAITAAFSKKFRYLLLGGSIRSGKTYVWMAVLIVLCKVYPGSRWFIIRRDYPTLKRNTIPTFNRICPKKFLYNFNRSELIATFTNGSEIGFISEGIDTDPELKKLDGLDASGFLLEEADQPGLKAGLA